jgi:hypothetical protein
MHGNGTSHLAYSIHQTVWTMVQSLTSPTFCLDGPVGLRVIVNGNFVTCRSCLGFKLFSSRLLLLLPSSPCLLSRDPASHVSPTRLVPWPIVEKSTQSNSDGSMMLLIFMTSR